jgi:hypothetical protein
MGGTARILAGLAAVAALLLGGGPSAHAGYAIVDQQGLETVVSKGRVKHASRTAEQPVVVFDVGRGRLWFANPRTRSYWEGTADEFCTSMRSTVASAMSEVEKQMKDQLAKLPPDQRAQVEQMMKQALQGQAGQRGAAPAPRVTVERTAEQATIAGLPAKRYRVLTDGQPFQDLWLASDAGLLQEIHAGKASDAYARMSACQAGSAGPYAAVAESQEYRKLFGEGWPVRIVGYPTGTPQTLTEVVRVERRDVPESEFTPPAGFRKAPLMEVLGSR